MKIKEMSDLEVLEFLKINVDNFNLNLLRQHWFHVTDHDLEDKLNKRLQRICKEYSIKLDCYDNIELSLILLKREEKLKKLLN